MTLSGTAGKSLFVFLCVVLSILLVYLVSMRTAQSYTASLEFGIASANEKVKPDLVAEKKLILSDEILLQVMRELNLLPASTSRFRSFDLGKTDAVISDNQTKTKIAQFREGLSVLIKNDTSSIMIIHESGDSSEAKKTCQVLFEKYRNWRHEAASSDFDDRSVTIDKEISEKREIFLQSQKQMIDLMEGEKNSSDPLQAKKTELDAQILALQLRYGPKHPAMIEALKQRDALNQSKTAPVDNAQLSQLKKKLEVDFKNLDEAMRKSVVIDQQKSSSPSSVEILPMGDVIVRDSRGRMPLDLMAGAFSAFLLSLLYLKIRSRFRPHLLETPDDVKAATRFDLIASVSGLAESVTGELPMPSGHTAEKLKILRHELKLRGDGIKLVTITSSIEDEGVTALVAGLGRLAARAGENVIIIDADLRKPSLQRALPQNSIRNLVDYLSGQVRIEDVIYKSDGSGVHVIYGTAVPNTALDLISSEKMKTLLYSLREVYDLVLLLAPPSCDGPDARILSAVSDQTLYCTKTAKTGRKQVQSGLSGFTEGSTSIVMIQS